MADDDNAIAGFTMLAHGMFHTYELSIPIFIVIWLDVFDVSAAVLGTVIGLGYGLIGIGAVPSGILADRYGSRTLIIASVVGMSGGFFLLSLAPNVYVLAIAIMIWGAAASVYHPAGLSLISRCANERGTVFAYHGVGGNVGTALGPLTAALLLVFLDWQWVVRLLALPAVPVVLFGSRIGFDDAVQPSSTDGGRESFDLQGVFAQSRLLFTTGFTLAFVVVMLYGTYYRGLLTFLPDMIAGLPRFEPVSVFGQTADPAQYIYTGLLMVGILGQYTGGRITDHVRTEYALLASLAVLAGLAFVFLPSSAVGVAPFLLVCALLGFTLYATAPIYQVVIAERADENVHGLSYGFTYLGMFGFGAAGAALAGTLLTYFDAPALLGVLGVIALVAAILVVVLLRRP
ncbi:MFS transporter [Halomarina halobia]|uniref:MFS transporter n=1 Tax=Halomarina halobia TaxID=3033386 RepID=A0ABD6ADA1_9EURY|nr:MFS transporter [Halomarina sp. PSR21]